MALPSTNSHFRGKSKTSRLISAVKSNASRNTIDGIVDSMLTAKDRSLLSMTDEMMTAEYELIQAKQSKLPRYDRDFIVAAVERRMLHEAMRTTRESVITAPEASDEVRIASQRIADE